jgi:stage II sporulation protein M
MLELIQSYKKIAWYSKPWLLRALWIFTTGIVLGGITGSLTPELLTPIFKSLSDEFGSDPGLTPAFAKGIFIQNITVSAFAALGGVIIGILPFLVLLINGFLIGYIVVAIGLFGPSNPAANFTSVLIGIIPHGIIEIPTFIIASALGLQLGVRWITEPRGEKLAAFKSSLISIAYAAPLILILLFIAAIIEVFVTGRLLS